MSVVKKDSFQKAEGNLKFGVALGLTRTAQAGQAASVKAIEREFVVRTPWHTKSPIGIKITAATKQTLSAAVHTRAYFLAIQEKGGPRAARDGGDLAVPTSEVRPTPSAVIPRRLRPRGLKDAVRVRDKKGRILLVQRNKSKRNQSKKVRIFYFLKPTVQIKARPVFNEPVTQAVKKEYKRLLSESLRSSFTK